ncbi:hypothetical protein C2S51_013392 [Perilla frutescens var. frutescens]|nr:hypothetical protein C2S51_013392 [Perilla frutescens var. frutescens]
MIQNSLFCREAKISNWIDGSANWFCDWGNCIVVNQNLLQQRTLCKPVTSDIGYYSDSLLLDDVGNCILGADESSDCTDFE